jgi:SAM-dependent methyltransferase
MTSCEDYPIRPAGGSFRDPKGSLFKLGPRTIRIVTKDGVDDLTAFLASRTAQQFMQAGRLVSTRILEPGEAYSILAGIPSGTLIRNPALVVEHETIPFRSFPYEWPFEMLRAAAELTLDLAESALSEGFGLKDASSYNILFRGTEPVFVDILSFEKRDARDPIWLACGQFERTFLIPLLSCAELDLPLQMLLLSRRDGLYPRDVQGIFGFAKRLKPTVLSSVTMPAILERRGGSPSAGEHQRRLAPTAEQAAFVLARLFRRLRKTIRSIPKPKGGASRWFHYMRDRKSYSDTQFHEKALFVEEALAEFNPASVLDIGCNTGHFSVVAARNGVSVVAIDSDARVIGQLWNEAKARKARILPLAVNIAQPSPAIGWRNLEAPSFLDRAGEGFDAVLMLAVIHHLLVTDRIPLHDILDLVAELTRTIAVVEFVSADDPMFRGIAGVNQHLYTDLTNEVFRAACLKRFEIVREARLSASHRWMYVLSRRAT